MKSVLFIAYFFEPYPGVGAYRVSYWARNLSKLGFKPIVITATPNPISIDGGEVHFVEDTQEKRGLIQDQGHSWLPSLEKFIEGFNTKIDYTVITGGPFMHMGVANKCRELLESKVLLDFRDPFATHPRAGKTVIKSALKRRYESGFCKAADQVICVNKYCGELIATGSTPLAIIDNGYDDSVRLPAISTTEGLFVYAGKFYHEEITRNLLEVLQQLNGLSFTHAGPSYEPIAKFESWTGYMSHGMLPYPEALEVISTCEVAVLFDSGSKFESTTKVFDYIALNKKILVISSDLQEEGAIQDILNDYPNKVFCNGDHDSITQGVKEILSMSTADCDPKPWSRQRGLERLVALLNDLG